MSKFVSVLAVSLLAGTGVSAAAQPVVGSDAAACRAGAAGPAFLVDVRGLKNDDGKLRVQLYPANKDFLAKGKWLRRVDLPVTGTSMRVCIAAPRAGTYGIAVRHDADGNGKSGWNDGGGFSGNPSISLTDLRPTANEVAVSIGSGVRAVDVVMNYRRGLSIGPIARN
ncbi:MAG TPA: DUF2141 domain-containing protein [Allosphingosinicella sp.]|nr:DUF2141 domain-containing protein [Allosphingosinicella sp.]